MQYERGCYKEVEREDMTEIREGVVIIRKGMTNWGIDAFSVENADGTNESVMFFMEDLQDFLKAVDRFKKEMEGKDDKTLSETE